MILMIWTDFSETNQTYIM